MSDVTTATVETMTAEVHVLMVGKRQITLSVARQLDHIRFADIDPMGRINIGKKCSECPDDSTHVIGRDLESGSLAIASVSWFRDDLDTADHLPLIILAGLK